MQKEACKDHKTIYSRQQRQRWKKRQFKEEEKRLRKEDTKINNIIAGPRFLSVLIIIRVGLTVKTHSRFLWIEDRLEPRCLFVLGISWHRQRIVVSIRFMHFSGILLRGGVHSEQT
jgi:hypothetical protein